jgi:hypothetical protein
VDLRIFGSAGMLLLDFERERLELFRRDGRDVHVPSPLAPAPIPAMGRQRASWS